MPNAQHALSVPARIARQVGQHCIWWHPYEPSSGVEALGAEHLSDGDGHIISESFNQVVISQGRVLPAHTDV